jgi:hypothetical protein
MGSLTHSPTVRYPLSSDAVNELIKARGTAKGPGGQAITSIEKWIQAAIDGKPEG